MIPSVECDSSLGHLIGRKQVSRQKGRKAQLRNGKQSCFVKSQASQEGSVAEGAALELDHRGSETTVRSVPLLVKK